MFEKVSMSVDDGVRFAAFVKARAATMGPDEEISLGRALVESGVTFERFEEPWAGCCDGSPDTQCRNPFCPSKASGAGDTGDPHPDSLGDDDD